MNHPLHKLIHDLPSEEYHGTPGTWSSSQLKDILKDEEHFHKKYITKEIAKVDMAAFHVGNYFHTGTTQPHLIKSECAVYTGKIRRGEDWEKFKKKHKGKAIVTVREKGIAENLITAVKKSPIAMGRLKRGSAEVSVFIEIIVYAGDIYAPHFGKVLTRDGWIQSDRKNFKGGVRLILKARADLLADSFVLDLKSTTGNPKDWREIKSTIKNLDYNLSASLYLDLFALMNPNITEFIWTFASKETFTAKSWLADEDNILVGRAKWSKAILMLASCIQSEWEFEDSLGIIGPTVEEKMEYLKQKDTDFL